MFQLFSILLISQIFISSIKAVPLNGEGVDPVRKGEYTFVVSITLAQSSAHICNGALVTKRHVVTLSKCVIDRRQEDLRVLVGSNLRSEADAFKVSSWITYDTWAANRLELPSNYNDVAVLTLSNKVSDSNITIAGMYNRPNRNLQNISAILAGWSSDDPNLMSTAYVSVLSSQECGQRMTNLLRAYFVIPEKLLCSFSEPYVLLGPGEAGGPIFDDKNFLIGINKATFPKHLDPSLKVNLHLNINYFREFIQDVMKATIRANPGHCQVTNL